MSVHRGRKQRGRQLTAKRRCIIHAACKLASCSLLKRNCSEFAMHFLFPHSRAAADELQVSYGVVSTQTTVSFCFPSSVILQRSRFDTFVFLMCYIAYSTVSDWIIQHAQCPTCSFVYFQYICCVVFSSFIYSLIYLFIPPESIEVPQGVMQLWIIGT